MAKFKSNCAQIILSLVVCVGSSLLGFILGGNKLVAVEGNSKIIIANTPEIQVLQPADEKIVEWLGISKQDPTNRPFKLSNFAVRKSKLTPYLKFSAKAFAEKEGRQVDDWLEDLQFTLKNLSDKKITFILLELGFPETEVRGPKMVYQLKIGLGLKPTADEVQYIKPIAIPPGEDFLFTLSPQHLKGIKDFLALKNFRLAELNRVEILISPIIYEDGIMWANGNLYKPSPNAPHGYERIIQ